MSKYAGLGEYLKAQRTEIVAMRFADIERIMGGKLPPSAFKHRPWWSNNPKNSVMTKVWRDAGFQTEQVDMAGEKLVFRRVAGPAATPAREVPARSRHPLFGALKGLLTVAPRTDVTQPADAEWGDVEPRW